MGKSLGNTIDPNELIKSFGVDAVRWYLLRDIQFGDDGDIQQKRLLDLVNNDLANTIGNLVNRSIAMARKWFDGVPNPLIPPGKDHRLAIVCEQIRSQLDSRYIELNFRSAAEDVLLLAGDANGFLSETAPWSAIKDPNNRDQVASDLYAVLESCRWLGVLLFPLLPGLSIRLLDQLAEASPNWETQLHWGLLTPGKKLAEPTPLMQRLELEAEL
jgi:methionyl-tRNA synthetase